MAERFDPSLYHSDRLWFKKTQLRPSFHKQPIHTNLISSCWRKDFTACRPDVSAMSTTPFTETTCIASFQTP